MTTRTLTEIKPAASHAEAAAPTAATCATHQL